MVLYSWTKRQNHLYSYTFRHVSFPPLVIVVPALIADLPAYERSEPTVVAPVIQLKKV
jgi:hypothetical protein